MLSDSEPSILCRGRYSLSEVGIGKERAIGGADHAGASRRGAVLLGRRTPAVDHGAGHRAVQLTHAGRRSLLESPQHQALMLLMATLFLCGGKNVRVALVDTCHLGVRLVSVLSVRVQSQRAGDVAVRVRRGQGRWANKLPSKGTSDIKQDVKHSGKRCLLF